MAEQTGGELNHLSCILKLTHVYAAGLGMDSVLKGKNVELYTRVTANYDHNKQLPLDATKNFTAIR